MNTGLETFHAFEPSRGDLLSYLIDMGGEMSGLALQAGCPTASAMFTLATAELRKVKLD